MKRLILLIVILLSGLFELHAAVWHQKASFGGVGRHRAFGMSIFNKGYIGLGHVNGTGMDISYKDWWQYDPAADSWSQKADFPVAVHGAVGFSIDKKGYVGGGSVLNGEFYVYDPLLNTWSPIASCPLSPGDTQGFSIQNKGYVYQGDQLAEFNPVTNSWELKANSPIVFSAWSSSFSSSGSGFIKSGIYLYEYKPSVNQWLQRANFPGSMSNGSSAFSIEDKGYFTCGYVGGLSTVTDEVWEFNPGNNTWTPVAEFPGIKRRFPVAFSINGFGYFGTGTNGINLNDFWQFDPNNMGLLEGVSAEKEFFTVFPNPTTDIFQVQMNTALQYEDYSFRLIGLDGEIIQTIDVLSESFEVELNAIVPGIYLLRLEEKGKSLSMQRIVFI